MNTNEELKTRPDFESLAKHICGWEYSEYKNLLIKDVRNVSLGYKSCWTTHVEPLQAENNDLHLKAAELHSLKMSLLESPLKEFLPKKEMSFHDKILFAIHGLQHAKLLAYDQTQEIAKNLQSENQKLREQLKYCHGRMAEAYKEIRDKTNP